MIEPGIHFLYTNIGRGHPSYLDGILEALLRSRRIRLVRQQCDVFELSRGVSYHAWRMVYSLYHNGGNQGLLGWLYGRIRRHTDYNRSSRSLQILGRDIRERFRESSSPIVVAHPILVAVLRDVADVIYQHGEMVAPTESLVRGAAKVLVPLPETADAFIGAGYEPEQVVVTGLCVEPSLRAMALDCFEARLNRIEDGRPLTGGFYSSGAEPRRHVETLARSAVSVVQKGGRALIVARRGGRLVRAVHRVFGTAGVEYLAVDHRKGIGSDPPRAMLLQFASRREDSILTARWFNEMDYFVAPAHERSNWAMGLGIPMFIVGPHVGPYAALNAAMLQESGAAEVISRPQDSRTFGPHVSRLRADGKLSHMARAGWGKRAIDGFEQIAQLLVGHSGTPSV